ncbi:MAG TPA: TolC family protein [Steroidobacteraceae bacterium]|nr:TolC family protein [Steroidobacteraceae bacterium]
MDEQLNDKLKRFSTPDSFERFHRDGWSVAELLVAAAQFNPSIDVARAKVSVASAAVKTAKALPNPTLSLSSEYDLSRAAESPWLWAMSSDFLLEGSRRKIRTQLADAGVRVARLDYAEALWSVRRDLRASLLSLVIAEQKVAILKLALNDREQLTQQLARRVALGEAATSERVQSELELSRSRTALVQATQQTQQARAHLAALIGIPLAALAQQHLRFDDLAAPQSVDAGKLNELRSRALLSRADLEQAIIEYQNRELELHREIRNQYPTFSVAPGYTYDHGVRKATLGISFSLPVFNRNQGPIAEAEAQRTVAEKHLLAVQTQILSEIDSARSAVQASIEALNTVREQTNQARALVASTEHGLAVGTADRPALLAAKLNASNDELALLDAEERAQQSIGLLEDALRAPVSGVELSLHLGEDQ